MIRFVVLIINDAYKLYRPYIISTRLENLPQFNGYIKTDLCVCHQILSVRGCVGGLVRVRSTNCSAIGFLENLFANSDGRHPFKTLQFTRPRRRNTYSIFSAKMKIQ